MQGLLRLRGIEHWILHDCVLYASAYHKLCSSCAWDEENRQCRQEVFAQEESDHVHLTYTTDARQLLAKQILRHHCRVHDLPVVASRRQSSGKGSPSFHTKAVIDESQQKSLT